MSIAFTYELKTLPNGDKIGPAYLLPIDAVTGRESSGSLYGYADIPSLDILADFSASAVSKYDFPFTKVEYLYEKMSDGYDTGNGYTLALGDNDRNAFTQLLVLLREAGAADDQMVTIADTSDALHQVSVAELRPMLVSYGMYYNQLWAEYKSSISGSA